MSLKSILFICLFLLCFQKCFAISVDEQLKHLSISEKECLRHFFARAIKIDHLGHVLFFSNKPACLSGGFLEGKKSLENRVFFKGWEVLRKNEHLFPHPNFIIYDEIIDFGDDGLVLHIYIVNKKTLLNCLTQNENIIKKMIESNFSKEKFLTSLEERSTKSLMEEDQALIGILLGFGNESAFDFRKYAKQSLEERRKHLQRISCSRKEKLTVHPVAFMGNPCSEEVQHLKETYSRELEKICERFEKRDLLKMSLEALCNP